MSLLGNILWLIMGGLIAGLLYIVFGAVLCLTIVGIPFGMQSIKLGLATMCPFGKEVVADPRAGALKVLFDIIWLVIAGWEIALTHLTFGFIFAITIVGLPFAKQHFKLVPVALMPFNHDLR
ncbi:MAG: YccF domain-containing protein [Anaerolineales bacterium]